jgi:multimeric flavodoxin WrbA
VPKLLVIHHAPTAATRAVIDAVLAGANDPEIDGVDVRSAPALEATATDVVAADGYILGTPANFGYMSGALKHFFDSTFLDIGGALDEHGGAGRPAGATAKRPYGLVVHGRYDTAGAVRSVLSIVQALGWRQAHEVIEVIGEPDDADVASAYELGATVAANLMAGA